MIENDLSIPENRPGRSVNEILYGTLNNPCQPPATSDYWRNEAGYRDRDATISYPTEKAELAGTGFDGTWLDNRLGWRTRVRLFAIYLISAIGLFITVTAALNFIAKF